jgi:hypothetical protein
MKTKEEADNVWTYMWPLTDELTAWIDYLRSTYEWIDLDLDTESGYVRFDLHDLVALVYMTRRDELLLAAFKADRERLLRQLGGLKLERPL